MTKAVIIATGRARGGAGPGPAAALPYGGGRADPGGPDGPPTLLTRLCDQLTTLNVPDVHVLGRPDLAPPLRADGHFVTECEDAAADLREIARLARLADEPLLILPADLVASDEPLARLVDGSGTQVAALTVPRRRGRTYGAAGVRIDVQRVADAGPGLPDRAVPNPNAGFAGVLRFSPGQAGTVAGIADELAGLQKPGTEADAAELLLAGLVRSGVPVAAFPCRGRPCRRVRDGEEARAARAAVENGDDAARLAAAVKADDGFFATFAVGSYSPYLVRWAARRDLTPTTVTVGSAALALLAAMWFTAGTRAGMVTGAVLLYVSFVLDCVDGQLARYTGRTSVFGAWLDSVLDRGKEYAAYAGLAVGYSVADPGGDVWGLAIAVLILQTLRHMADFSYRVRAAPPPAGLTVPLLAPDAARPSVPHPRGWTAGLVVLRSRLTGRRRAAHWARKIAVLPIGERFALIAVTAVLADARVTFLALLAGGAIAAAYTMSGRVPRTAS